MGVILPFVSAGAFEPNDIEAMSLACEEVCNYLHINGDARARETIAARVIELAQRGERCPSVLRGQVLAEANAGPGRWLMRLGVASRTRANDDLRLKNA
ncbi:hypothetical protein ACSHT2_08430 [Bradyrhizobium sp. PUT101]|jgi:hypothetical protein|uniref:hypothetical protein n=1 Tax=Bradyrhizobium sp. PUT101 TaxID=3447427 RepID=UPI003F831662